MSQKGCDEASGVFECPLILGIIFTPALQGIQEGEQLIFGTVGSGSSLVRGGLGKDLLLQCEVSVEVDLRGFDRFMSEPQRDDGGVDTSLQQLHCRGVPQYVRCYTPALQGWTGLARDGHVLG